MPGWLRSAMWVFTVFAWPCVVLVRIVVHHSVPELGYLGAPLSGFSGLALRLTARGRHKLARQRRCQEAARLAMLEHRCDSLDQRVTVCARKVDGHQEQLTAQELAWKLWREARGGKPDLYVVGS